eukprot:Lithocolla_globosa_v1_NODE_478_length_3945_cov_67.207712.p5 type:complete len:116 gc:universal NODE_478_length_3945_cov_67.207712:1499-1152(-)
MSTRPTLLSMTLASPPGVLPLGSSIGMLPPLGGRTGMLTPRRPWVLLTLWTRGARRARGARVLLSRQERVDGLVTRSVKMSSTIMAPTIKNCSVSTTLLSGQDSVVRSDQLACCY